MPYRPGHVGHEKGWKRYGPLWSQPSRYCIKLLASHKDQVHSYTTTLMERHVVENVCEPAREQNALNVVIFTQDKKNHLHLSHPLKSVKSFPWGKENSFLSTRQNHHQNKQPQNKQMPSQIPPTHACSHTAHTCSTPLCTSPSPDVS